MMNTIIKLWLTPVVIGILTSLVSSAIMQYVKNDIKKSLIVGVLALISAIIISKVLIPNLVSVPNFKNRSEAEAKVILKNLGLEERLKYDWNSDVSKHIIFNQDPEPFIKVQKGSVVSLTISKGPRLIAVPNVFYRSEKEAEEDIKKTGLKVEKKYKNSEDKMKHRVILQDPTAGIKLNVGEKVELTIGLGNLNTQNSDTLKNEISRTESILTDRINLKELQVLSEYPFYVSDVKFSPDSNYLAVALNGSKVFLYKLISGKFKKIWNYSQKKDDYSNQSVSFSPDNQYLLFGHYKKYGQFAKVNIIDKTIKAISHDNNNIDVIEFSPNNLFIAAGIGSIGAGYSGPPIFSSPSEEDIEKALNWSRSRPGLVNIFNSSGMYLKSFSVKGSYVTTLKFSPEGHYLAVGRFNDIVYIYDTSNWKEIKQLVDCRCAPRSLSFSPDGQYLAVGSCGNALLIYKTTTWELLKWITGQPKITSAVSFTPDSRFLISGGSEPYRMKAYKVGSWENIATFEPHESNINSISISPNGKYLAAGGFDDKLHIYIIEETNNLSNR